MKFLGKYRNFQHILQDFSWCKNKLEITIVIHVTFGIQISQKNFKNPVIQTLE